MNNGTYQLVDQGLQTFRVPGQLPLYSKRFKWFQNADLKNVFILTEDYGSQAPSVTNAVEYIIKAAMVERDALRPDNTLFVEHYTSEARGGDEETFDVVTVGKPGLFFEGGGRPTWTRTSREELEKSLGQRVDL